MIIIKDDIVYVKSHLSKYYSNMVVYRTMGIIKKLLQMAINERIIDYNVTKDVKMPKLRYKTTNTISLENFYKIIEEIKKSKPKRNNKNEIILYLTLIFKTGLRQAEVRALKWSDIDFTSSTLTVSKSIFCFRYNNDYKIVEPKTRSSNRTIHIDKALGEELKKYRNSKIMNNKNNDFIFCRSDGHPRISEFSKSQLRKACNNLGIYITTHGLRHSHASYLLKKNINILSISKRLGHSNVLVTLKYYCHLMERDEKDIMDLMQNI